jgi:hypothetical protein
VNILDKAREQLSTYEKLKENKGGLYHLKLGLTGLCEILQGDQVSDQKTIAKNIAMSYRKMTVFWVQKILPGESNSLSEIEKIEHCRSLIDCFNDINVLIGSDSEFRLLQDRIKKQLERSIKSEEYSGITQNIVTQILALPRDKQEAPLELFDRIRIPEIRQRVERERTKQETRLTAIKDFQDGTYQEKDVYIYSIKNAKAGMVIRGGLYIILKESTAIAEETNSIPVSTKKLRKDLINIRALVYDPDANLLRFTKDVPFKSPSAASSVVSAGSTDGNKCFNIKT